MRMLIFAASLPLLLTSIFAEHAGAYTPMPRDKGPDNDKGPPFRPSESRLRVRHHDALKEEGLARLTRREEHLRTRQLSTVPEYDEEEDSRSRPKRHDRRYSYAGGVSRYDSEGHAIANRDRFQGAGRQHSRSSFRSSSSRSLASMDSSNSFSHYDSEELEHSSFSDREDRRGKFGLQNNRKSIHIAAQSALGGLGVAGFGAAVGLGVARHIKLKNCQNAHPNDNPNDTSHKCGKPGILGLRKRGLDLDGLSISRKANLGLPRRSTPLRQVETTARRLTKRSLRPRTEEQPSRPKSSKKPSQGEQNEEERRTQEEEMAHQRAEQAQDEEHQRAQQTHLADMSRKVEQMQETAQRKSEMQRKDRIQQELMKGSGLRRSQSEKMLSSSSSDVASDRRISPASSDLRSDKKLSPSTSNSGFNSGFGSPFAGSSADSGGHSVARHMDDDPGRAVFRQFTGRASPTHDLEWPPRDPRFNGPLSTIPSEERRRAHTHSSGSTHTASSIAGSLSESLSPSTDRARSRWWKWPLFGTAAGGAGTGVTLGVIKAMRDKRCRQNPELCAESGIGKNHPGQKTAQQGGPSPQVSIGASGLPPLPPNKHQGQGNGQQGQPQGIEDSAYQRIGLHRRTFLAG